MNNEKTFFILEDCGIVPNSEIKILEEQTTPSGSINKVVIKTRLQDNQVNGNRRLYPDGVLNEIVHQLEPKARNRSLLLEMNHPFYNGNADDFKRRAVQIDLDNICAVGRKIWNDSGTIYGEVESLSDGKGPRFRNYIVNDKLDIGFSLRMLGSVQPHATMENVAVVSTPLHAVTYDVVSHPSHKNAKMISFVTESTSKYLGSFDIHSASVLTESTLQERLLLENLQLPDTAEQTVRDYINKLITEGLANFSQPLSFKLS